MPKLKRDEMNCNEKMECAMLNEWEAMCDADVRRVVKVCR